MNHLIDQISKCTVCEEHLSHGPRPVVSFHPQAKVAIIGQAPGIKVHESGIAWNDKSGENLRQWLNIEPESFYDPKLFAIVPMGFCYPGKGKSGDLPPRTECAPLWHHQIFEQLKNIQLTLLIGKHAQDYYLKERSKQTLTETVQHFREYLPEYFVLPHPSPRNNIWQARNPWFQNETLPTLKERIHQII